jgi:hypothetical protein
MRKRSAEALKVLADLDAELAAAGESLGEMLSWTAAEIEMREMLANTIDRRARVGTLYEQATDPKVIVKISVELRQLDGAVMKIMKAIKTEVPQQESMTTVKARRAANTRWERERNASV